MIRVGSPIATCVAAALVFSGFGCEGPDLALPEGAGYETSSHAVTIPAKGSATTLDVASWNIEWFGDSSNGPTNEPLQLQNARDVINGAAMDIWGAAEIVNLSQWNTLKSQLPGFAGFLASESIVTNGSTFYAASEQKVGLLYRTSVATLLSARLILTASDADFAGRPPLEAKLRVTINGTTADLVVIVLHAKCCSDTTSYQRRVNASAALKTYLDNTYPTAKVLVVGDWNDDVDTSIFPDHASPYANFVSDSADYFYPTKALSDAGQSSTTDFPDVIDHHLTSNESAATLIAGSTEIYRVDNYISSYASTTSDHFPVLSRYSWGSGGGGGTAQLIINEIGANEPGSDTAGEFVELVNVGTGTADLSGWSIWDATGIRHTFAGGTTVAAGKAIVVFGGASAIPAGLSNAVVASTGTLSLANGGDSVVIKDAAGTGKDNFTYSSALSGSDGVSMNRSPDTTPGAAFVLHTALSGLSSSPGKRVSGAAF